MLPDWIPLEAWEEYLSMRKKMGKKHAATDYAQKLLIKRLDEFRNQGMSVQGILEQSIMRSWVGVFPLQADKKQFVPETTQLDSVAKTKKLLESYDKNLGKSSSAREAFLQVKSQLRH